MLFTVATDAQLATMAASSTSGQRLHELGSSMADTAGQREPARLPGERLVSELVEAGAVPALLRLRGLGYPRYAKHVSPSSKDYCQG